MYGGGIYNYDSSPVLTGGTVSGNTASDSGGGIYNETNSSPTLTGVTVSGNTATNSGGGIANANSSPTLTGVTVSGNSAAYNNGGGIDNNNSSPVLTGVTVSGNSAANNSGGGIANNNSSPVLIGGTVSGNKAIYGGGIYNENNSSPKLTNGTVSGNRATSNGGGISNENNSSSKLYNSIVWGNKAPTGGNIHNTDSSAPVYSYSLIEGSGGSGGWTSSFGTDSGNNIDDNPLFADWLDPSQGGWTATTGGDYSLQPTSPAIDAGDNTLYENAFTSFGGWAAATDLAGNRRKMGQAIDMGAYEEQILPTPTPDGSNILYVKDGGAGALDGSSWADAYPNLADPLLAAETNAAIEQIWVAEGTYYPLHKAAELDDDGIPTTDRDKAFVLVSGVEIYGGFPADANDTDHAKTDSRPLPSPATLTTLSGDLGGDDTPGDLTVGRSDNAYHVVIGADIATGGATVLDGFTVTGGNADDSSGSFITVNGMHIYRDCGGGIYNVESSPTLTNLAVSENSADYGGGGIYNSDSSPALTGGTVSGNTASIYGGGIYNDYYSSPTLTGVTVSGNTADADYGGGIFNNDHSSPTLTDVTVSGNTADSGGGIFNADSSSPVLTGVTVSGNTADDDGGGICNSDSSPTFTNVTVSGNTADDCGGGIFNEMSSPVLTNVTVSGNEATNGGGIYNSDYSSPTLIGGTVSGNSATTNGGGIFNYYDSSPTLTNVTVSGNMATNGGGIYNDDYSSPELKNTIVWGNTAAAGESVHDADVNSVPTYEYSLVRGLDPPGTDNLDGTDLDNDPLFVDWADPSQSGWTPTTGGDYRLQAGSPGSPAIDAGDDQSYLDARGAAGFAGETDLAGNPRLFGTAIDMGAYEYQNPIVPDGGIVYVKAGGAGALDGSSWANAYPNLADPLLAAETNPDIEQIWVAAGTYRPLYKAADVDDQGAPTTARDKAFVLVEGVKIYGGFPANANDTDHATTDSRPLPSLATLTTLSGDLGGNDGSSVYTDNAYHVVIGADIATGGAVLDGFTVTGGNADDSSGSLITVNGRDIARAYGGGIYNDASSPVLTNLTISGNSAEEAGGIANNHSSSPVLTGVTVSGNTATGSGGGIVNANSSSPVLTGVTVSGNTAGGDGGGIVNVNASSPVLTGVTVSGNTATGDGGGICNSQSSPVLIGVLVSGNKAESCGGIGNYNSTVALTNSTVAGNQADASSGYGGGIASGNSAVTLANSIVAGNGASDAPDIFTALGTTELFYSLLGDDDAGSIGLASDPDGNSLSDIPAADIFAAPLSPGAAPTTGGDYSLKTGSQAVGAGDNQSYLDARGGIADFAGETDLAGNPRRSGAAIDMGAYEFPSPEPDGNGVLHVKQGGNGDGSSWQDALPELADALLAAKTYADIQQIWVAAGTYKPLYKAAVVDNLGNPTTDRDKAFVLVEGVKIYGGFPADANDTDHATTDSRPLPTLTTLTTLSGDLHYN
jgi:parallel beta-helix repeat protein